MGETFSRHRSVPLWNQWWHFKSMLQLKNQIISWEGGTVPLPTKLLKKRLEWAACQALLPCLSERTRGNGLHLHQGMFRLVIRIFFPLEEWLGIGVSCSGMWWSHYSWKCSRGIWIRHLEMWFRGDYVAVGLIAGLHGVEGLFQPWRFCDSVKLWFSLLERESNSEYQVVNVTIFFAGLQLWLLLVLYNTHDHKQLDWNVIGRDPRQGNLGQHLLLIICLGLSV